MSAWSDKADKVCNDRYPHSLRLTPAHLLVGSVNGVLSVFPLPSVDAPTPDGMAEPERTLIEHTANLCCLDTSPRGLIASGSWDQ